VPSVIKPRSLLFDAIRPDRSGHENIEAHRGARAPIGNIGAVAFSRTGDPASGEFADAVLKAFGEVPSDLSA
jgi:hypothetical protein